jgi:FkbM family methyltransferase
VAATHRRLLRQLALNGLESRVTAHQAAVGAAAGELRFSTDRDSMNQLVGASYGGESAMAPVLAIDDLPSLGHSACWKLDVEGHEAAVLTGAARTLAEASPATILCEDRSPAVQATLIAAGFQPCTYNPFSRQLIPDSSAPGGNQLWAQNLSWTQERLQSAPAFSVLGERI